MTVTAFAYTTGIKNEYNGTSVVDFDTNTIKVALLTSTYTPDVDNHDFFNDVSANEVAASGGYTAGGKTLTTPVVTAGSSPNKIKLDADDVSWAASTITARYAVVYRDTGTASTSPLLGYVDFGNNVSSVGGVFNITWNAAGILEFTRQ